MVTVLGMWEHGWMDAERTERRLWKQTIQSFAVDHWAMSDVRGGPFSSPLQHDTPEAMLEAHSGPKTFLIKPGVVDRSEKLSAYVHPPNAIYVLGNALRGLEDLVSDADSVVSICTPRGAALFACAALAAVLYDRMVKRGH